MNNYPEGSESYLARRDSYEERYEEESRFAHNACLYLIVDDPNEFINEWVNAEIQPSVQFVRQWARLRKKSEKLAREFARGKHRMLEDALTKWTACETEKLMEE